MSSANPLYRPSVKMIRKANRLEIERAIEAVKGPRDSTKQDAWFLKEWRLLSKRRAWNQGFENDNDYIRWYRDVYRRGHPRP
jgi:hypothetical protein